MSETKCCHLHMRPMVTRIFSFINLGVIDQLDELPCMCHTFVAIGITKKLETCKFSQKTNNLSNQHRCVEGIVCSCTKYQVKSSDV